MGASHVATGDLVDRNFLFGTGNGVKFGYEVCDFSLFEDDLDVVIKSFRAFKREKLISRIICISIYDLLGHTVQRNNHSSSILLNCLCRNIFNSPVDNVSFLKAQQVTNTTADITLEDKDVSLNCQMRRIG